MPHLIRVIRQIPLRLSCSLAVLSILGVSSTFADDVRFNSKTGADQKRASETGQIPDCLEKLKLSSKQQDEVKGIVQKYDASLDKVWNEFSDRYMKTITLESSMLAAIEDHFTDEQRQQIRNQRRKTAQHEEAADVTKSQPNQPKPKTDDVVKEELATTGVSLTSEQQSMAEQIQDKYRARLRSMNREIQGLHIRLLSLEAGKLAAIEAVLTKDQLEQLRSERQQTSNGTKVSVSKPVLDKAE